MKTVPLLWFAFVFCLRVEAQTYDTNNVVVQTFAGSGFSGYVDGQGTQTMFNNPNAIAVDTQSNLFVLERFNSRIRKITQDGAVSTFVGGGTGSLPGFGTNVSLAVYAFGVTPGSVTIDNANNLWIVTSIGNGGGFFKVRTDGFVSATTNLTGLSYISSGVCVDSANNIYYSASGENRIYRWRANGVLEVFAGSGNSGAVDGNGIFTSFNYPKALAADSADNIYVWDSNNYIVRRINQNRDVVTIAGHNGSISDGTGTNASFVSISAMCVDNSGNVIIACDSAGASIRKMTAATNVTTFAGSFTQMGYANGVGSLARFNGVNYGLGVCVSGNTIYVADSSNQRIRSLTFNPSPQIVSGANLDLSTYAGLKISGVVGRTYQIQSSADTTNWTTRATLLLNSSPYLWIDQNPVNGNKFYRALLLP